MGLCTGPFLPGRFALCPAATLQHGGRGVASQGREGPVGWVAPAGPLALLLWPSSQGGYDGRSSWQVPAGRGARERVPGSLWERLWLASHHRFTRQLRVRVEVSVACAKEKRARAKGKAARVMPCGAGQPAEM